jgi:pilus assembly protein CpaE
MSDTIFSVRIEVNNPGLKKNIASIIQSTAGFQLQRSDDSRTSDILIFELGDDVEGDLDSIRSLLNSNAVREVFLTSKNPDPAVLIKAMRTGTKEFFAQPIKEEEVRLALDSFKKRRNETVEIKAPTRSGRIIDVIGSKGGVGTTTVAVNLAVNLAEDKESSVVLIDMNMLFGDVPAFLGLKPDYNWSEITQNVDRLDSTFLTNILSEHSSGVYVLSSPGYLDGQHTVTSNIIGHLLSLMQTMFDFVVIDGGQSMDESSLRIIKMSHEVMIVSLLNLTCLSNTSKLMKSLTNMGYIPRENMKVIINRYIKNAEISLDDAEAGIEQKIFWAIPNDYKTTMSAINQGIVLSQVASNSKIAKNIKGLSQAIKKVKESEEDEGGKWWDFLRKKKRQKADEEASI